MFRAINFIFTLIYLFIVRHINKTFTVPTYKITHIIMLAIWKDRCTKKLKD